MALWWLRSVDRVSVQTRVVAVRAFWKTSALGRRPRGTGPLCVIPHGASLLGARLKTGKRKVLSPRAEVCARVRAHQTRALGGPGGEDGGRSWGGGGEAETPDEAEAGADTRHKVPPVLRKLRSPRPRRDP